MGKSYLLVEGHGETSAADNLVTRLNTALGIHRPWAPASRWKNLHLRRGLEKGAERIRIQRDADALLILRDEDDACPAERGPEMASWLRDLRLPFPAAIVLFHPEYEVLFLPCLSQMVGRPLGSGPSARPGLLPSATWNGSWESRRGIKEWLTAHFPPNRSYKPTLDQLHLTRMLDFTTLRSSDLACFGTLERALEFLGKGAPGSVYPGG